MQETKKKCWLKLLLVVLVAFLAGGVFCGVASNVDVKAQYLKPVPVKDGKGGYYVAGRINSNERTLYLLYKCRNGSGWQKKLSRSDDDYALCFGLEIREDTLLVSVLYSAQKYPTKETGGVRVEFITLDAENGLEMSRVSSQYLER